MSCSKPVRVNSPVPNTDEVDGQSTCELGVASTTAEGGS